MISSGSLRQRRALVYGAEALVLGVIAWLVVAGVVANRTPAGSPVIAVSDVWARATPPGATTGAVYLTIGNTGDAPDTLVRVTTSAAGIVIIHQTNVIDNLATMAPMAGGIAVERSGEIVLAPGGSHLMLSDLTGPLVEGTTFPVTLEFVDAGRIEVQATVLGFGAMGLPATP